jgi:glycerol-3-phosphate acyltransferase PlsY
MNNFLAVAVAAVISYLIGSFNLAIIISNKIGEKKDIRTLGSKNAGFSNSVRSLGTKVGIFVFTCDFLKGVIAIITAHLIASSINASVCGLYYFLYIIIFTCFVGHLFPCYYGFKGGKGILVLWAMSFFLDWKISAWLLGVFFIFLLASKMVSLASIAAAFFYPILGFIFLPKKNKTESVLMICMLSITTILKHKSNIKRILNKTERKLNF